jgi:hypothetical protein
MATTLDQTKNEDFLLCWARGDNDPKTFTIRDGQGVAIDISGWTLSMAVNSDKDPLNTINEIFSVAGVFVTDGTDGRISFTPPANSLDNVGAGEVAFYDINRLTPSIKTLVKGQVKFLMDIDKT